MVMIHREGQLFTIPYPLVGLRPLDRLPVLSDEIGLSQVFTHRRLLPPALPRLQGKRADSVAFADSPPEAAKIASSMAVVPKRLA